MSDLTLRQVGDDDRWVLWGWRNSARVRRVSTSDAEITPDEHDAWFTDRLPRMHDHNLVVQWRGTPVGWFQVEGWDPATRTGEWGMGLGEAATPGLGGALPVLALGHAFERLHATAMGARVLELNTNVLSIMRRLGIPVTGETPPAARLDGTTAVATTYRVEAAEWPLIRERGLGLLPSALRAAVVQALDSPVAPYSGRRA